MGGHFDRFLRACALARRFQEAGILYLDISDKFEPLRGGSDYCPTRPPTDQQMMDANKAGLVWQQDLTADEKNPVAVADPHPIFQPGRHPCPPRRPQRPATGNKKDTRDKDG